MLYVYIYFNMEHLFFVWVRIHSIEDRQYGLHLDKQTNSLFFATNI